MRDERGNDVDYSAKAKRMRMIDQIMMEDLSANKDIFFGWNTIIFNRLSASKTDRQYRKLLI